MSFQSLIFNYTIINSQIPAMHVKAKEMHAVLSYLKIEIGWFFYKILFTDDEKVEIEERRKMVSTGSSTQIAKENSQQDKIKFVLV